MPVKLVAFAVLGIGLAVRALFYFVRDNFENKSYEYRHHRSDNYSSPNSWNVATSGYDTYNRNKNKGARRNSKCTICQDDLSTSIGRRDLKCGHAFHAICINRWIQEEPVCPNCRKQI